MQTATLTIEGMSCEGCVKSATKALLAVNGVSNAAITLEGGACQVSYDPALVQPAALRRAIEDAGFDVAA